MHIYTFLHMLLRPSFLRLGQCLTLAALLVAKKLGRCQAVPWGEDLPGKHQGGWGAIGEGEGVKTTPNSASQPLFTRSPSPSHIVNNFLTQLFLPAGDKNHPKVTLALHRHHLSDYGHLSRSISWLTKQTKHFVNPGISQILNESISQHVISYYHVPLMLPEISNDSMYSVYILRCTRTVNIPSLA